MRDLIGFPVEPGIGQAFRPVFDCMRAANRLSLKHRRDGFFQQFASKGHKSAPRA